MRQIKLLFLPKKEMEGFSKKCFVCHKDISPEKSILNPEVNLPVCENCSGTENEKKSIEEYFERLAEDLVCGCI